MSNSLRLTVGTIVGFFTGVGFLGLSAVDTQNLTNNVDAIVGGILAAISLIGFIEHHIQQSKVQQTKTTTEPLAQTPQV